MRIRFRRTKNFLFDCKLLGSNFNLESSKVFYDSIFPQKTSDN
jgi:hypothetical protein